MTNNIADHVLIVEAIGASVLGGCEGFEQTTEGFAFDNPEGRGFIRRATRPAQGWVVTLPDGRTATSADPVHAINSAVEAPIPGQRIHDRLVRAEDRATTPNEGAVMEIWILTVSCVGDEPTCAAYTTEAAAVEEARVQMNPVNDPEAEAEEYEPQGRIRVFGTGSGDEARVTPVTVRD